MKKIDKRNHGLDILRTVAIILVFIFHYVVFVSRQPTFGFIETIGWVGVDLFFVLSGYLIGNQIFSLIVNHQEFSLKIFYSRRLLRTLPNYLFVLMLYFFIPGFRENLILPSFWKFLTFTQNFNLQAGTAFSHAWSLCIEEQFYLILPALALIIRYKKSPYCGWMILCGLLVMGIVLRGARWIYYSLPEDHITHALYYTKIYYFSFCRLDELVFGVALAMVQNFHKNTWKAIIDKGNLVLLFAVISCIVCGYLFLNYSYSLWLTVFGYPFLGVSFSLLTLAALSPKSYLSKIRIPGAQLLALWSYAIYLTHKPVSVFVYRMLSKHGVGATRFIMIFTITLASLMQVGHCTR